MVTKWSHDVLVVPRRIRAPTIYARSVRRVSGAVELLDGDLDPATLRGNLRDLARVNRWLGGVDLSWRALRPVLPKDEAASLLDVGTGAADIPLALLERARRSGLGLRVVATDVRSEIVALARDAADAADAANTAEVVAPGRRSVEIKLGSADRIDEDDASFDFVHASLVLHHLEPGPAVSLLREMGRVARRAVIINDLDRGPHWWLGAWLLAHLATTNRYTRHDAPLSVRRAYRPSEVAAMGAQAGLNETHRCRSTPAYRYVIVLARDGGTDA